MQNQGILTKLRRHPLIDLLFTLKGNAKVLVFIEPFWGIPHSLIAPFATVYMRAMGVSTIQIGLALSIAMLTQVISGFFGGIIADKIGRKTATMVGDLIGWALPCAIWAVAQNYWFFLAAMMLNSFEQINQTSWVCLMIEDTPKKTILNIWNWVLIGGLIAVFFSPISGAMIQRFALIPIMRVLYAMFSLFMVIKTAITYKYTRETKQGTIRKRETKDISVRQMLGENMKLMPKIFRNRNTMAVLAIMVLFGISSMISGNFYSLYATSALGIPENYLAYFPIIRACIMLLFFGFQHKLDRFRTKAPMAVGVMLYIASQVLLILSPKQTVVPLVVYTFIEAVAFGLVVPRREMLVAFFVDKAERARIVALLTTTAILITMPFGGIAGALSKVDERLPFVLNVGLYVLAMVCILKLREDPSADSEDEEDDEEEAQPA